MTICARNTGKYSERQKRCRLFSKISVILPSLDPDEKLNAVIDGLLEYGFSSIILVNDGSKQENLHYFTTAPRLIPKFICSIMR